MSAVPRQMLRRIAASVGSNAYAQLTTIGIQLLSLPFFLSKWDLSTYGHWLIISAIPAYIQMADVGMVTAAGNSMTMLVGEGDRRRANAMFQSVLAFMLLVCAGVIVVMGGVLAAWPAGALPTADSRGAIALLSLGVIVSLLGGLPEAVYKATERYALGNALANTTRLFEWLGSLTGLWLGGDFISVALGALVPRLLCTIAMAIHCARSTPDFKWGFADATLVEIKRSAGPAISFMVFPAANALNFQGMTLVAAAVLGPAATVVFNTYRTMARVTVQATATFGHALWPEFSRLFGRRDLDALGALFRRSQWLGIALATGAGAVVYLVAPTVLQLWSKGHIDFMPRLMLVAMAYAAAAGFWHVSRVLLLSTNEHRGLAWPYLAASALMLPIGWALAKAFGLEGIMLAMLAIEVAMFLLCHRLSKRLLTPACPAEPPLAVAS
jgi:O-antigen/teichoic acid export membrane protein